MTGLIDAMESGPSPVDANTVAALLRTDTLDQWLPWVRRVHQEPDGSHARELLRVLDDPHQFDSPMVAEMLREVVVIIRQRRGVDAASPSGT